MRVVWFVRDNLTTHTGGDTTQILKTADGLRARGVQVTLTSDPRVELSRFDLAHLFHLDRLWENEPICRRLRQTGMPAVLSTIYWPADEFDRHARAGFQGMLARTIGSRGYENLRLMQRALLHAGRAPRRLSLSSRMLSFRRAGRSVLETVRAILPNSIAEQQVIERTFGVACPAVVVPNAADVGLFHVEAGAAGPRTGVLCVGRIEPRKNQLALIEALRDSAVPLTLVGQAGRYSRRYYEKCRRRGADRVTFAPPCDAAELRKHYNAACVHACVSWYETPGLVSLEAALCGCAIVATPGGCTREYLGSDAQYAEPADPSSIREAVEAAIAAGPQDALADRIRTQYTWSEAAAATQSAYELALAE